MEVFLYNSTVCRLCGEENDNGTLLYSSGENSEDLSAVINKYLPIQISDDGQLPRTICPGCTIQLEATVEFLNLIIHGQRVLRDLHQREKEYKKSVQKAATSSQVITENIVYEVNTSTGIYLVEHPIALQVEGLDKPKRKRGRPPKKNKTPEEISQEESVQEAPNVDDSNDKEEECNGKRRRKTPQRFSGVVQGKELERIFKEEGVTDGEDSDNEAPPADDSATQQSGPKEPEVIGHMENSGELVFLVKGKGRGRPKGRMRQTHEKCAICGKEFSSVGRYMAHIAQHGPVKYQCTACSEIFATLITFKEHQSATGHEGRNVVASDDGGNKDIDNSTPKASPNKDKSPETEDAADVSTSAEKQSELDPLSGIENEDGKKTEDGSKIDSLDVDELQPNAIKVEIKEEIAQVALSPEKSDPYSPSEEAAAKTKYKCPICEKLFSSRQSRSVHVKALHRGERPHECTECDAKFAYPRSLALHLISHKRKRAKGYACDLCGKVLNHPSSVVYHKQAEHAGTKFVCNTCGKTFKHKQLLRKHQLVHTQARPFTCKICNSTFKTKANMANHQLLHTGVKKYSCDVCKHKFAHKTSLTLHMRLHTGHKPYSCSVCGKCFSQKGNLLEHERIHTGEKPFQCGHCARRFTTSSQHRLHLRRHTVERPYGCNNCGKKFAARSSWLSHMRREAGTLTHRCSLCSRAFAEKWSLQKHMRLHTGERPFKCPHCPRQFADSSNLNKHKRHIHKQVSLLAPVSQASTQLPQHSEISPELVQQVLQQDIPQSPKPLTKTVGKTITNVGKAVTTVGKVISTSVGKRIAPVPKPILSNTVEPAEQQHVIYVAYDMGSGSTPAYHILEDAEPLENVEQETLYTGESLLVSRQELALQPPVEAMEEEPEDISQTIVLNTTQQHIPVTDEQGNPLHFTMEDGTRLAITSVDGKTLQVVTQDGETIPVEINGYNDSGENAKYIVSNLCM